MNQRSVLNVTLIIYDVIFVHLISLYRIAANQVICHADRTGPHLYFISLATSGYYFAYPIFFSFIFPFLVVSLDS